MDRISPGDKLFFQRSDGSVQEVTCTAVNAKHQVVTGEWAEESIIKGKDVALRQLVDINPEIFKGMPSPQAPIATGSSIPKPVFGGTGHKAERRKSFAGTQYAERQRNLPPSGLPAPKRSQIPPIATSRSAYEVASTARISLGNVRNASTTYGHKSEEGNTVKGSQRCSQVVNEVKRMKEEREQRRARNAEQLLEKDALRRQDPGNPNWEVAIMLREYRETLTFNPLRCLNPNGAAVMQITVCVRKRPMSRREERMKNMDIITVPTKDSLIVHELRYKVDLTKFLDHHKFRFDYTFDEQCSNTLVYDHTARPLIRTMFEGGNATCFAYGQTGSGKTHTMGGEFCGKVQDCSTGIYALAARDVFQEVSQPEYRKMGARITCSYFEIYGSKVFDLLHPDKPLLRVLEDGRQQVVVVGLKEMPVTKVDDVLRLIALGNKMRTSGQTSANAKSSRSHAIFQMAIHLPDAWGPFGKCSFVDLAGNERGADTQSADRQTRIEGAEINKSLLALKECIRALSRQSSHLPFRGSKLTQVLRDSFVGGKKNKTCMIAMISPSMSCVEHSLNTLRYADRVKELVAKDDDCQERNDDKEDVEEGGPPLNLEESDPEISEEEENAYEDEDDSKAHAITISSDEPSFPSPLNNNNNSSTLSQSYGNLDPLPRIKVLEVAEQHESMIRCLDSFVKTFKNLNSRTNFENYLSTLERPIQELATVVNKTSNLVSNYNTQHGLKGARSRPSQEEDND